jgi:hypothetical protein
MDAFFFRSIIMIISSGFQGTTYSDLPGATTFIYNFKKPFLFNEG